MGWSSLSARVAGVVAPFALSTRGFWSELPIVLFAGGAFAASVVIQRGIRETLNAPLLNSVAEVDEAELKFWKKGFIGLPRSETMAASYPRSPTLGATQIEMSGVSRPSKELSAEDIAKLAV